MNAYMRAGAVLLWAAMSCKGENQIEPTGTKPSVGNPRSSVASTTMSKPDDRSREFLEHPDVKAHIARVQAAVSRGALSLVLIDKPLGAGILAEIHLNAPGPVTHFFVVPTASLTDEIIDKATDLALSYQLDFPDDESAVRISLRNNGTYVRESSLHGRVEAHQRFEGFYTTPDRRSKELRDVAKKTKPTVVAGIGAGRVIKLDGAE